MALVATRPETRHRPDAVTTAGDRHVPAMIRAVLALLRDSVVKSEDFEGVWRRVFRAGAEAARFETRLDVINANAVLAAEARGAQMVAHVDATTRAALARITASGLSGLASPREVEAAMRQVVGLDARRAQSVLSYRVALAEQTGGVLSGSGEAKAARFADRMLRDRAETIARTETLRAAHQGELANWRDARDRGVFTHATKRWLVTPDDRTCPECAPLDGEAVDMDGDWTSNAGAVTDMPPVHPQCRCTTTLEVDL